MSSSSGKTVDILDVYHNDQRHHGQLRITSQGVGWKCSDPEVRVVTFTGSDIKQAVWTRVARGYRLRLTVGKSGDRHTFEGLKRADLEAVQKALKVFDVEVDVKELSVRGWNWGKADVQANDLAFTVGARGNTLFELPLSAVSNSNMAGKNEVAIEFAGPSNVSGKAGDELVEMRFYIPQAGGGGDDDASEAEIELDDDGNEITPAEAFHRAITDRADIGEAAGDAIVTFGEVLVVTPRGRFDVEMHADHLRLHGKTYDYRVLYKSVHRQFLLPKLDGVHRQLVVGLDPPLRQGQTKYPWLVMQWDETEEVDVTLNIEDDVRQSKYKGLVKKEYSDPTYVVVSQLFRHLIGKEMTPPSETYKSVVGDSGIKCNVKAVQGELYFLEKGMIFVAKQPIHIDFARIEKATMSRLAGAMRTCDITVQLDSGSDVQFTAINKDELQGISRYLKSKDVRVKEAAEDTSGMRDIDAMDLGDDDDDDDEDAVDVEDDGRRKKAKPAGRSAPADDDDSEDDGDFGADSGSDSGSASDSGSESDSGASTVSDDMVKDAQAREKKKADANRGKTKVIGGSGGMEVDGDDEEGAPPAKKKARKD